MPHAHAVEAARDALRKLRPERPRDLEMLHLAAAHRVFARVGHVERGDAHIVCAGGMGVATIDARAVEEGAHGFCVAHELGHCILDPGIADLGACKITKSDGNRRLREQCANDFAAEATMPEEIFLPFIRRLGRAPGATIDHLFEAADSFRVPDDSVALRFLLFSTLPCAAAVSIDGRVRWWAASATFRSLIPWGGRVDARTLAAKLHRGERVHRRGQSTAAGVWERSEATREVFEQAVRLRKPGAVLSWLVEPQIV